MSVKGTRERILKASLGIFSERGYLGTTTKEIAMEADVAEVTLFRHFLSKERLFGEVVKTYSFLPTLKGLLPELRDMDYREALSEIARRFLERLSERKALIRIMHAEAHRYPEKVKEIYHHFIDETFKTLASYFKGMQERGAIRDFDPEIGARAFLGMFFSYFNSREMLTNKKTKTMNGEVIEGFVDIFIKGTMQ
jgi:AcrR family transcriptional regulator